MTKKKLLQYGIVLIILVLSYGVYLFFSAKGGNMPEETIRIDEVSQGEDPLGKFSDGWATEIRSREEWEKAGFSDYLVVTATDVIPTGVYVRKAWIGPYDAGSSNVHTKRRKTPIPQESTNPLTDVIYMSQYYLIKLEDGSYINGLMEEQYVQKIKKEGRFTLPVGQKTGVTRRAEEMLEEVTAQYQGEPTPVLYMIQDDWQREHQTDNQFTAILWGVGTFLLLTVASAVGFKRVFVEEKEG